MASHRGPAAAGPSDEITFPWLSELQGNANRDDPRPDFPVDRSFWL